jgi:subtilisin family serine protease
LLAVGSIAPPALAGGHPSGASLVRLLGKHAGLALSATGRTDTLEALVRLPPGVSAASLGAEPVVPGFGRVRGGERALFAFAAAHPEVPLEVAPPLHTLLDTAGITIGALAAHAAQAYGDGVLVGVADTGLDVTHPDFLDADGHTRVAWLIDMSAQPLGIYPDLERKYGVLDDSGNVASGAVVAAKDIDALLQAKGSAPGDDVGHGTHVTSIAAGNGGASLATPSKYLGVASHAQIVFARITRDATDSIDNGDLQRGAQFLFDRADFMKLPVAVNLSLGSDFGPHDGTLDWEQVLASYVGPSQPGHALIAAAGNSGSIADSPVHQSVAVTGGGSIAVPITTTGAKQGTMQVWLTFRAGASVKVGLNGPDGQWIAQQGDGQEAGKNTDTYNAAVLNGSSAPNTLVPTGSSGAIVVVTGNWPSGTYDIVVEGQGTVDMYLEGTGDVVLGTTAGFQNPVREGTINLPATNASIIGVGCTMNKAKWTSIDGAVESEGVPVLDALGGYVVPDPNQPGQPLVAQPHVGDVCWFSSAGPTVTGVPKPEIAAPGGIVVAAMSSEALPGGPSSVFTTVCPARASGEDAGVRCLQVDATHGVSQGTSMSAPMVSGAVALLFQRDPTLTQDKIVGLLQAGAHRFSGAAPWEDQSGPGELDIMGTLDALDQSRDPALTLPDPAQSWLTLSADYAAADGSTPVTAILELRASSSRRADLFDPHRLQPVLVVGGEAQAPPELVRRAPGVWFYTFTPPRGLGGSSVTFGATFDGQPIVASRTIPIAVDIWRAEYATKVKGGCAIEPPARERGRFAAVAVLLGMLAFAGAWRRASASTRPGRQR